MTTSIVFSGAAHAELLLGDVNCDGAVTEADVDGLVHALFNGSTCSQADVNGDGGITTADVVLLLQQPITEPEATATANGTETPNQTPPPSSTTPVASPTRTNTQSVGTLVPTATGTATSSATRSGTATQTPHRDDPDVDRHPIADGNRDARTGDRNQHADGERYHNQHEHPPLGHAD